MKTEGTALEMCGRGGKVKGEVLRWTITGRRKAGEGKCNGRKI